MEKLKIKELRVGNYVNAEVGLPSLQFHELLCRDFNYINYGTIEVYGIELTESILLNFGFTTEYPTLKDKFFTIKNRFNINSFNFGTGFKLNTSGCFEYKSIKYVHQLQNIYFDLTGNELILI